MSDDKRSDSTSNDGRRAKLNLYEKKRRDRMKAGYDGLREALPISHENDAPLQVTKSEILENTIDYIESLMKEDAQDQLEIDCIMKINKQLEEQIYEQERRLEMNIAAISKAIPEPLRQVLLQTGNSNPEEASHEFSLHFKEQDMSAMVKDAAEKS